MNKNGGEMRIKEAELALIKSTFAENDTLLKTIRKVFFQVELTQTDKDILSVVSSSEIQAILRKIFLPEIDVNAPLGQNIDLYMTIDVKGKEPIDVSYELEGRSKVIGFIEKGLKRLETLSTFGEGEFITFTPSNIRVNSDQDMIAVTARNTFIQHVELQLIQLRTLAGLKSESVEETKTRLAKNSTK